MTWKSIYTVGEAQIIWSSVPKKDGKRSRDRQDWCWDLPPVRNGPAVRGFYSQSVAAAHSKFHAWYHGDDPRAEETLWHQLWVIFQPFILIDSCLLTRLIYLGLTLYEKCEICEGQIFVSVDFLSVSDLSLVRCFPNNMEILSPHENNRFHLLGAVFCLV